jgi:hypothetical protein
MGQDVDGTAKPAAVSSSLFFPLPSLVSPLTPY